MHYFVFCLVLMAVAPMPVLAQQEPEPEAPTLEESAYWIAISLEEIQRQLAEIQDQLGLSGAIADMTAMDRSVFDLSVELHKTEDERAELEGEIADLRRRSEATGLAGWEARKLTDREAALERARSRIDEINQTLETRKSQRAELERIVNEEIEKKKGR
jgi:hypothetical protein